MDMLSLQYFTVIFNACNHLPKQLKNVLYFKSNKICDKKTFKTRTKMLKCRTAALASLSPNTKIATKTIYLKLK